MDEIIKENENPISESQNSLKLNTEEEKEHNSIDDSESQSIFKKYNNIGNQNFQTKISSIPENSNEIKEKKKKKKRKMKMSTLII